MTAAHCTALAPQAAPTPAAQRQKGNSTAVPATTTGEQPARRGQGWERTIAEEDDLALVCVQHHAHHVAAHKVGGVGGHAPPAHAHHAVTECSKQTPGRAFSHCSKVSFSSFVGQSNLSRGTSHQCAPPGQAPLCVMAHAAVRPAQPLTTPQHTHRRKQATAQCPPATPPSHTH